MKVSRWFIIQLILFVLMGWARTGAAAEEKLVAPLYPGAVPLRHPEYVIGSVLPNDPLRVDQSGLTRQAEAFFTRDDINRVRDYYEKQMGVLRNDYLYGTTSNPNGKNWPYVYSRVVCTFSETEKILSRHGKSSRPARDVGLQITSKEISATLTVQNSPYFMPFRNLTGRFGRSDKDLKEVYARFRSLDELYFQMTEELGDDGRFLSEDETMFRSCFIRLEGGIEPGERPALEKKIQRMIEQNKMEEAIEEGRKLNTPVVPGEKDTWTGWVNCLEKIELRGYRTLLRIDKNPADWGN